MVRRGLSLIETVVGLFLLLAGVFMALELMISGFRQQSQSLQLNQAVASAEEAMEGVKQWGRDPANFATNWSIYRDLRSAVPDLPNGERQILVPAVKELIYSPCQASEVSRPGGGRKLGLDMVTIEVWVRWGARDPVHSVHLVSQLAQAAQAVRNVDPLTVTFPSGFSGSLARDATVLGEAQLWDSSNQRIGGVPVIWSVLSDSGMGTLDPTVDLSMKTTTLYHRFYSIDPETPPIEYAPGTVRLYARARYAGAIYEAYSPDVVLSP